MSVNMIIWLNDPYAKNLDVVKFLFSIYSSFFQISCEQKKTYQAEYRITYGDDAEAEVFIHIQEIKASLILKHFTMQCMASTL
jgi:hypothetical protein